MMGQNLSGAPTNLRRPKERRQDKYVEAAVAAASRHTTTSAFRPTSRKPDLIEQEDRRLEAAIAARQAELKAVREAADRNRVQQQSVSRIALSHRLPELLILAENTTCL